MEEIYSGKNAAERILKDAKKTLRKFRVGIAVLVSGLSGAIGGFIVTNQVPEDIKNGLEQCEQSGINREVLRNLSRVGVIEATSSIDAANEVTISRPNGDEVRITLERIAECTRLHDEKGALTAMKIGRSMTLAGSAAAIGASGYLGTRFDKARVARMNVKAENPSSRGISR